jgi:hypothetical protein
MYRRNSRRNTYRDVNKMKFGMGNGNRMGNEKDCTAFRTEKKALDTKYRELENKTKVEETLLTDAERAKRLEFENKMKELDTTMKTQVTAAAAAHKTAHTALETQYGMTRKEHGEKRTKHIKVKTELQTAKQNEERALQTKYPECR